MNKLKSILSANTVLFVCISFIAISASNTNTANGFDLEYWKQKPSINKANQKVDHSAFDQFLNTYLNDQHFSKINRFNYKSVSKNDHQKLKKYINYLQTIPIRSYSNNEQMAFIANLYNAVTIDIVLQHYPVESIRKINISGFFSIGPWGKNLVKVENIDLSLNDLETILRLKFKDSRAHYIVNCASMGCPNLSKKAYTADAMEALYEKGATDFINHPRGVTFNGDQLVLSKIYKWYKSDFGGSEKAVLKHLIKYAKGGLKQRLIAYNGDIDYQYDWDINKN